MRSLAGYQAGFASRETLTIALNHCMKRAVGDASGSGSCQAHKVSKFSDFMLLGLACCYACIMNCRSAYGSGLHYGDDMQVLKCVMTGSSNIILLH